MRRLRASSILDSLEFLTESELKKIEKKVSEVLKSGDFKTEKNISDILDPLFEKHPKCKFFNLGGYGKDDWELSYEIEPGYNEDPSIQNYLDDSGENEKPEELFLDIVLHEEDGEKFEKLLNQLLKTSDFPYFDSSDGEDCDRESSYIYVYVHDSKEVETYDSYYGDGTSYEDDECF